MAKKKKKLSEFEWFIISTLGSLAVYGITWWWQQPKVGQVLRIGQAMPPGHTYQMEVPANTDTGSLMTNLTAQGWTNLKVITTGISPSLAAPTGAIVLQGTNSGSNALAVLDQTAVVMS